ncbi:MAG: helix-turn-helix domain-containing protein [Culicoidibacterales bacterium]
MLQLHENLVKLRKIRGITQAQLAAFIGVTKASVSKWETGQSLPDILLLPQLAAYYAVSVDELLGYEPQLNKQQIQKLYHEFANDFASKPYEQVMEQSDELVKKYYACYPFLLQMALLWLNHVNLASTPQRQKQVFEEIRGLCQHIQRQTSELKTSQDAFMLESLIDLQLGENERVVERLEPFVDPYRLIKTSEISLIQAYQQQGEMQKAQRLIQMNMFQHIILIVNNATFYLQIDSQNWRRCMETMTRIDQLITLYQLATLNPNSIASYQYQVALTAMMHNKPEVALARLHEYVQVVEQLVSNGAKLQGDSYFDTLDDWFQAADLGVKPVRNEKLIIASSLESLQHPLFATLQTTPEFQLLKHKLTKRGTQR